MHITCTRFSLAWLRYTSNSKQSLRFANCDFSYFFSFVKRCVHPKGLCLSVPICFSPFSVASFSFIHFHAWLHSHCSSINTKRGYSDRRIIFFDCTTANWQRVWFKEICDWILQISFTKIHLYKLIAKIYLMLSAWYTGPYLICIDESMYLLFIFMMFCIVEKYRFVLDRLNFIWHWSIKHFIANIIKCLIVSSIYLKKMFWAIDSVIFLLLLFARIKFEIFCSFYIFF